MNKSLLNQTDIEMPIDRSAQSIPTVTEPTITEATTAPAPRLRLHYLDGLRGLAALYVVLTHAYLQVTMKPESVQLPDWVWSATKWLEYGNFSVVIFIILSGYCLALPIARSQALKQGFWHYLQRRAKRMIPPYYGGLILSWVLIATVPLLQQSTGTIWDSVHPAFKPQYIITHLLLVHNILGGYTTINYPLWTVSTEWQIYFTLPLILLPLWKRFGLAKMLGVAILLGYLPPMIFHGKLEMMKLWYFSHFAFGVTAAIVSLSTNPKLIKFRQQMPWGWLSGFFSILALTIALPQSREWMTQYELYIDFLVCLAAVSFLMYAHQSSSQMLEHQTARSNFAPGIWILSVLNHPWIIHLGVFSYSLYLTHAPILALCDLPLQAAGVSPMVRLGLDFAIATPLCVGFAYLFYWLIERHFINSPAPQKSSPN